MTKKSFASYAEVLAAVGQDVALTDWVTITQEQINLFADATGDHQWIHVDPERASQGPFGAPVAHGFLTLSLLARFLQESTGVEGAKVGVNYGLNKVRFPAPVPVGSRLRGHIKLLAAEAVAPDGMQMTWGVTVEREGSDKPVCVAESLSRSYGAAMG
ncbi:MaoC family dehydratase [Comamonas sp. GB3 AK4-5]|uniref:MaoC family dehydratase n=1 Tax=Comamonas sp. GB3 AK4-5 TaxID=3231487 RepID=UPI00351DCB64